MHVQAQRAEPAQQLAIEARVQAQAFGDGQDHLPVRDRKTHVFGHVHGGHQGAFLMARRAGAALLAGKGDKHLMPTVRAAHAGEAVMQVAAVEKGRHGTLDDRPPKAVLGLKALVVDPLEGPEMPVQQAPQGGGPRIARAVQGQGLDTRRRHDRKSTGPVMVYVPSLEQMYTYCQPGGCPPCF